MPPETTGRAQPRHVETESAPDVDVRVLRVHPADDRDAGDTLLVTAEPEADLTRDPRVGRWQELFVLSGRVRVGETWYGEDDYASFVDAHAFDEVVAGPGGVEGWVVRRVVADEPRKFADYERYEYDIHHPATRSREWGYVDALDNTDRLPLHFERTRGEATWLLRYPPGYDDGPPTRAEGVDVEVLVLSGEAMAEGLEAPLRSRDYRVFGMGTLPERWRSEHGCDLLVRTIARVED